MTAKNRRAKRSKISEAKFRELVKLFALDLEATQIAELANLNRNTVNRFLKAISERLAEHSEQQSPFAGEVEVDESFFGARHVKGEARAWRFGQDDRLRCLQAQRQGLHRDRARLTLQAVIRGKVEPERVIYSDNWRGYNGLVDVGYGKHLRVDHGRNEFAKGKTHINGIEGFWGFAKARLARFRGMRKATFNLHLKECEFRFNFRGDNLYRTILKIVHEKPLF